MRSVCGRVQMSRQNYYARQRQRRRVDGDLVAQLVRKERQLQPRLGTRKLQVLLKGELAQAGVKLGCSRSCALGILSQLDRATRGIGT